MQQKEERSSPSQMQQERGQQDKGTSERSQTPDQKGQSGRSTSDKAAEPREKATKGSAQRETERKERSTKGTADRNESKDKAGKSAAERPDSRDRAAEMQSEPKDRKGTAEKSGEPRDKATKGAAERETPSRDKAAGTERSGSGPRVQLTEEKRTNINQTILRDRNVNRITNVNFSINVGTRVPRSVRLVVLPASVIEIVPEYRSYRYFVVDDQICIVEPSTYEIVEVIRVSDRTAGRDSRRGFTAALMLTEREKEILLQEVDLRSDSTLALGALTEGAEVPRDVSLRTFSAAVVEQVPKVRDYKYVTAEHRLAIVDPRGSKVELVIEDRR
jgi:hypothetical protein